MIGFNVSLKLVTVFILWDYFKRIEDRKIKSSKSTNEIIDFFCEVATIFCYLKDQLNLEYPE